MGARPRLALAVLRLRRVLRNDQMFVALLAVLIGLATGAAVVGLRQAILGVQALGWGTSSERLYDHVRTLPWWQVMAVPVLGGLAAGAVARWLLPGGRPQGVAHVMEAAALHGGRMPLRTGLAAALASVLSLGGGASVGREGPAVHLGASISGWLSGRLRLGRSLSRALLGCGAGAAVAASFNAPIAGALFAHEVVVGHYALSAFAPVVVASVTATLVMRGQFDNVAAFQLPPLDLGSWAEFPAFAALGVAAALAALAFQQGVRLCEQASRRVPGPAVLRPALGGLGVGVIALAYPQVLGVGYAITDDSLHGQGEPALLLCLFLAKLAATALSLGFGMAGGVFGPALVLGALLGGAFGHAAAALAPGLASVPGIYGLVGMGALASAVLGAPLSTTLIVFELTQNYQVTMAVMLASVVSNVMAAQIGGKASFFHWQLARRGVDIQTDDRVRALAALRVDDIVRNDADILAPQARLSDIRRRLLARPEGEVFVVTESGALLGSITLADLDEAAFAADLDDLLNAGDVARRHPPILHPEDTLSHAIDTMRLHREDHMAVVTPDQGFVGWVHLADALDASNRVLRQMGRR